MSKKTTPPTEVKTSVVKATIPAGAKDAEADTVAKIKDVKEQQDQRSKAISVAISEIEKKFGKEAIMRMGEKPALNIETTPTGSISLDLALGGGIPSGRIIEIYGPEGSGKTTLTLHCLAEVQKGGGVAAFIDAEHALDPDYAKKIGVDINNLLISQPDSGEQALDILETLVRSNAVDVVVVDSVSALTPRAEIDGDMGDVHMGLQARLMSQALRKLTAIVSRSRTSIIFINQLRMKIGVVFGNPEVTSGGNALKFYSSVRLDIRRIGHIKDGDTIIGNEVRVKVVKNKIAPPFRIAEFDIMYNQGISYVGDLLNTCVKQGIITRTGSWFTYGDVKLGQGKENAKNTISTNKQLLKEIEKKLQKAIKEIS